MSGLGGVQRGGDLIIPINDSVSSACDLWGKQLVGFIMPDDWDAADLTFKTALTGDAFSGDNTYRDLYHQTILVIVNVAGGKQVNFDLDTIAKFKGVRHLKVVSYSGAGGATVNQTTARTIIPLVN